MALWLIGGTQESRHCVAGILGSGENSQPLIVTVATASAKSLYPYPVGIVVRVGQLNAEQADTLIRQDSISAILDASHPFATQISTTAIALAQKYDLPYLRYERPIDNTPQNPWQDQFNRVGLVRLTTIEQVLSPTYLAPQERTLLTVGRRWLVLFQPWQQHTQLFARVLPMPGAIADAMTAGFIRQQLVAMYPPVSLELELALWRQWQLTQVITKASGDPGGEATKQSAAAQLGIRLIVIDRPNLAYPLQTHCLERAIAFGCDPVTAIRAIATSGN